MGKRYLFEINNSDKKVIFSQRKQEEEKLRAKRQEEADKRAWKRAEEYRKQAEIKSREAEEKKKAVEEAFRREDQERIERSKKLEDEKRMQETKKHKDVVTKTDSGNGKKQTKTIKIIKFIVSWIITLSVITFIIITFGLKNEFECKSYNVTVNGEATGLSFIMITDFEPDNKDKHYILKDDINQFVSTIKLGDGTFSDHEKDIYMWDNDKVFWHKNTGISLLLQDGNYNIISDGSKEYTVSAIRIKDSDKSTSDWINIEEIIKNENLKVNHLDYNNYNILIE